MLPVGGARVGVAHLGGDRAAGRDEDVLVTAGAAHAHPEPLVRLMPEQDELIDILADDATLTRYDGGFSWTDTSKTISILLEQVRFAKVRARKTS